MSGAPPDEPQPTDAGARPGGAPADVDAEDEVDEASEESFPASDAPQGWAGPSGG